MKPTFFRLLAAVCALAGAHTISAQTARTQPQGAASNAPAAPGSLDPTGSQPAASGIIPIGSKLTFGGTNAPRTYHARTTFSSKPVVVAKGKVKIWQDQVATHSGGVKGEWDIFHMETTDGGRLAGNIKNDWDILMDYSLKEAVYFDAVVTQFAVSGTPVDPLYNFGSICCASASNPILPGEAFYNSGFQVDLAKGRQKNWEEIYIDPYDFASSGGIDPKTANQLTFALHFTRQKKAAVITSDAMQAEIRINSADLMARTYADANGVRHGFAPAANGAAVAFDAPGAGQRMGQGTFVPGGNAAGALTGYYIDAGGVSHGFVRAPDRFIATFDAPGAGTRANRGTVAAGIDAAGDVVGYYTDASGVSHAFVRAAGGAIASFDVPGAGMAAGQGTFAYTIEAGAVTGDYTDAGNISHGFVRTAGGVVTRFQAPGVGMGVDRELR